MGATVRVEEYDLGWNQIKQEVRKFKRSHTAVGYFAGRGTEPSTSIAARASVQEYGATIGVTKKMRGYFGYHFNVWLKKKELKIPSRPFMRQTFDKNKTKVKGMMDKGYDSILQRRCTARRALSRIGEWYTGMIKLTMRNGNFEPLSSFTTKFRGGTKPLIDTGEMRNSIRHREVMI